MIPAMTTLEVAMHKEQNAKTTGGWMTIRSV